MPNGWNSRVYMCNFNTTPFPKIPFKCSTPVCSYLSGKKINKSLVHSRLHTSIEDYTLPLNQAYIIIFKLRDQGRWLNGRWIVWNWQYILEDNHYLIAHTYLSGIPSSVWWLLPQHPTQNSGSISTPPNRKSRTLFPRSFILKETPTLMRLSNLPGNLHNGLIQ